MSQSVLASTTPLFLHSHVWKVLLTIHAATSNQLVTLANSMKVYALEQLIAYYEGRYIRSGKDCLPRMGTTVLSNVLLTRKTLKPIVAFVIRTIPDPESAKSCAAAQMSHKASLCTKSSSSTVGPLPRLAKTLGANGQLRSSSCHTHTHTRIKIPGARAHRRIICCMERRACRTVCLGCNPRRVLTAASRWTVC
jgi:hypothetical protein